MWKLILAELRYHRLRACAFYLGAVAVAAAANALFVFESPGVTRFAQQVLPDVGYLLFPATLLLAGLLLHVIVLWESDSERRFELHSTLPVSRAQAALARMAAPILFQLTGLALGIGLWTLIAAAGSLDASAAGSTFTVWEMTLEAIMFFCTANGAGLVFLLGWVYLAPEAEALKIRAPTLAWVATGASVAIALGASTLVLSPWLWPELRQQLSMSYPAAATVLYALAAMLAYVNVRLYAARENLADM